MTTTTVRTPNPTVAEMLMPGMHFTLFDKTCTVVYAEKNDFGMMVIRFVMDHDLGLQLNLNCIIVYADTLFPVYYL